MKQSITYRAAYWVSEDRQAEVVLTTESHAELPDHLLIAEAAKAANAVGVDLSTGEIVIGDWTDY